MYAGQRFALLLMCSAFVASGCVMAALGPALPDLAHQTDSSLAELGSMFTALFGGGLLAQIIGGPISDRFGRRVVLVVAAALFGIAAFGMTFSPNLPTLLVWTTVFGIGYAGITLAVNVLASELTPHRRAATLNLVNVFYAVGAIIGPLLAGRAITWWGTARPALWAGAVLMLIISPASLFALPAFHSSAKPQSTRDADAVARGNPTSTRTPTAFIWTTGLLVLLYVGSEAAVGGWTPTYLARSVGLDAARAATITSMFWLSLCIGRVLGTVGGLHMTAERLLLLSLFGAIAGAALLLAGHGFFWPTVIALILLGLSYGPIYPTNAAIVIAGAPHMAGTAMSRVGVFASIGGMALPWLQGVLLTNVGTAAAAAQTLAMACGMGVMWVILQKLEPHRA